MLGALLYIAIGLAILAALLFAYASTRPDTFRVTRSTRIAAAPEAIFPLINDLKKFTTWSPFEAKDPGLTRLHSGPERGPGQRYEWDGNAQVGAGSLEIINSKEPSRVDMVLTMLRPMKGKNNITFTIVPTGGASEVTWAIEGPVPFIMKVMHLVMNLDKMCGPDFETGLANLKAKVEGAAVQPAQN